MSNQSKKMRDYLNFMSYVNNEYKIMHKLEFYVLSLSILFLLLIILTINIPESCEFSEINWKDNYISIICILLLLYCCFIYEKLKYKLKGSPDIPFKITKIDNITYEPLSFLATYIIPLACLDFNSFRNFINLSLLLIIIGCIYVKTNLVYTNPSLVLLGFYVYKANGSFKGNEKRNDIILISKEKLSINTWISYLKLDENTYYVKISEARNEH